MEETTVLEYVKAAAVVMRLPMDEARAGRVAGHLQRTWAMARLLEQTPLDAGDEPAEIYRLERASRDALRHAPGEAPADVPGDASGDRSGGAR